MVLVVSTSPEPSHISAHRANDPCPHSLGDNLFFMKNLSLLVVGITLVAGCTRHGIVSSDVGLVVSTHPMTAPGHAIEMVAFHTSRVKTDPGGALGWAMLADSCLSVASQKDDDKMALKAEEAARKSLALRRKNNSQAAVALTKSLLAQHRFKDAEAAINDAKLIDPASEPIKRLAMEIMLELGKYDEFKHGETWLMVQDDPASIALKSRWKGLTGDNAMAVQYAQKALKKVDEISTLSAETVAWYQVQVGAAQVLAGDISGAEMSFDEALKLNPSSHKALGWKAKMAFEKGDWQAVLSWGEKARKEAKLTDIEGLMIQAKMKLGMVDEANTMLADLAKANLQPGQTLESAARHDHKPTKTRHTHDRLFAMTLADMGKHLQFAHHAAEEDLANRRDIYAEDAFAWTTYRYWKLTPASVTGEGDKLLIEAKDAMKRAMRTGSKDPKLLYHADLILNQRINNKTAN